MDGFDFLLDMLGELTMDETTNDISKISDDELRIQVAVVRIKSIDHNWFYDNVGANLEELIGKPIKGDTVSLGESKILNVLTMDGLWSRDDVYIQPEIKDNRNIIYTVYLKLYDENTEEESAYELEVSIDLVKGVKIRYGW